MDIDFCVSEGIYVYFKFQKNEGKNISGFSYIGSDIKKCKFPMMGDKIDINIKDIGFPKSDSFFVNLNRLNLPAGEYIIEMKCLKAGKGGFVRDFYEGVDLYKKAEFKTKNTNNKKEKYI